MKPLQLFALLVSLIASLALLSWIMTKATARSQANAPGRPHQQTPADGEHPDGEPEDKDIHKTNPFNPASGAQLPKLEIAEKEFQFGRMALGATGEHDFVIKNVGTAPAKIARGPVQCKCTLAKLANGELQPGEETVIHLSWTPRDGGPFSQSATIWTDDPENQEIKLIVSGEMFPEVSIAPTNGWTLGPISNSNDVPLEGYIESAVFEKFELTKIDVSSDRVELEAVPYPKEELEAKQLSSGYHLRGRLKGLETPQPIKEMITVHTDLKNLPKVEFPVTGSRTGSITIIGPNWFSGNRLLNIGQVSAEKGKEVKLTVILPPQEEELKLLEVTANPGFLTAQLKPEQVGKDLPRERYTLLVNVPANSPKGVWPEGAPGVLMLKTNHPIVQTLDIKVNLIIE